MTRFPVTQGSIFLDKLGISYVKHLYDYQKKGSEIAAEGLGVDLHSVVKTLIMQKEDNTPFIMLMHGDKEVSLKKLARQIGAKNVTTSEVKDAQKFSGYMVWRNKGTITSPVTSVTAALRLFTTPRRISLPRCLESASWPPG